MLHRLLKGHWYDPVATGYDFMYLVWGCAKCLTPPTSEAQDE